MCVGAGGGASVLFLVLFLCMYGMYTYMTYMYVIKFSLEVHLRTMCNIILLNT